MGKLLRSGVLLLGLVTLCAACGSPGKGHRYKLYPGPVRPAAELVTLQCSGAVSSFRVNGMRVDCGDYEFVELRAGTHQIAWGAEFSVSPLVNPMGRDESATEVTAALLAGRQYVVYADRTTGHGYQMYLWIEDATGGEVVAGRKKP